MERVVRHRLTPWLCGRFLPSPMRISAEAADNTAKLARAGAPSTGKSTAGSHEARHRQASWLAPLLFQLVNGLNAGKFSRGRNLSRPSKGVSAAIRRQCDILSYFLIWYGFVSYESWEHHLIIYQMGSYRMISAQDHSASIHITRFHSIRSQTIPRKIISYDIVWSRA